MKDFFIGGGNMHENEFKSSIISQACPSKREALSKN